MPTITLSQLHKRYPGATTPAVKGLDLTVKHGDFMCLLGPSGCGKTTILRMIAGIEHTTGGSIAIDDQMMDCVADGCFIPPEKRGIGLVFQSYALWPHMTVEQNVEFGLKLKKMPSEQRRARSLDVMEKLRIANYADRYPSQLSGGQQQRVALARMLAVNPGVLLLDEPLSNLDAALRLEMRAELRRLHQTFGTTIVFVSHDQWEAMTLATTIAVMSEGQLQQVGSPDEIYSSPANRFVAEFIGTPKLNMLDFSPAPTFEHSQIKQHIAHRYGSIHQVAHCGIRPEAVIVHPTPSSGSLAMTIESIMPTGGSWVVELVSGQDKLYHSTQIRPHYQVGDEVYCELPTAALHFFAPNGERLELLPCAIKAARNHSHLHAIGCAALA
ncbi:ABC transporter ATP-binding protein [Vibrio cholerae]|uniref:ABC transporter ATP-binding protein n=1 Tax=Vibrio cholerae TaxID=666 RepID=UPI001DC4F99F|nr:ABC transporter ATP-binding protein [Vibrio cholerae]EGR1098904.1 ABC transporter ATP-binding protein [Vibrio cholerae]MDV2361162.1 ABC transporter ATP-binding protein [Vibrio cholerae]GHX74185.1 ABC-type sugar transport system, ATPase component [Vibrio cholerae]HBK7260421.1 ABC transporter ATP-binding protein [Vibrio cholerae]HBK7271066.1 ABC transporter ATP-binding protein [Vibrio cholerae]